MDINFKYHSEGSVKSGTIEIMDISRKKFQVVDWFKTKRPCTQIMFHIVGTPLSEKRIFKVAFDDDNNMVYGMEPDLEPIKGILNGILWSHQLICWQENIQELHLATC